ncbi:TPA: DnaD domain protein [Streptococcus equi subsp. equi]|uniref:DnaD domain protein n=1 Tax=Streptococcus equi TaxID=1336 RepID=UPI000B5FC3B0|nr:DnaD domain protein [Streptococcus equi]ASB97384.1 replisome organizer [Streptococcus equi subsp. equi]MBT1196905.1 DnaD domain protein [Streptococcus equi subsp. equi]MBT1199650.1 DnaD domain protein [Streptococcus equi subsp. equi]MBT1219911.1 DnaD domain protein [Streptococcus equi subsp. equi]MBT1221654.1 DnaD domain protein [Streptococcus equi subsp. equi]
MGKEKTKIYFWLKFDKKFFENIFIKRLKKMAGGDTMTVLYIRLMLESLETDCILYYEGYFENLVEELAIKLEVSEDDINMTLAYFTKCGLIQIDGSGNAQMPQAKAMLESETNWAKYKRETRKIGQIPTNVQPMSNQCPTEIEIEKDKKKDINIDIKSEVEEEIKEISTADENSLKIISDYFQQEIGILSPNQFEQLSDYITITKMEVDVVKSAITRAADNSKRSFGYVNSILRNWRQNGITTMVKVKEESRNFKARKAKQEEVSEYDTW